jgi:Domain of unknown function (DUF1737)
LVYGAWIGWYTHKYLFDTLEFVYTGLGPHVGIKLLSLAFIRYIYKKTNTMAQILTYHVLQASTSDALAGAVQGAIQADWQPFGSIAVNTDKTGTVYSQPIVQYLPEAPKQLVAPAVV